MSASENVDLLRDKTLTVNGSVRTAAVATLSMTPNGQALNEYATSNSHGARGSGRIELLGDSSLPHASSSVSTIAVGSPIDLLGDVIIEPPAVTRSTPKHSSPVGLAVDSKHGAAPGAAAVSSQKPGGLEHGLPSGSLRCAVGSEEQLLKDKVLGLANDNVVQHQQQQQRLPTDALTNTRTEDQRHEQQELVEDSHASEALKAKITQAEQRSASAASIPPIVTFKSTQAEECPSSCTADGSLEDKVTDRASGGGSQSLPSDADRDRQSGDGAPSGEASEAPSSQGSEGDERIVDSDREVVEEEDAFGDFADFTSASHFLPGGGGVLGAVAFSALQTQAPPSASVAAARAAGVGPSNTSSPSSHRHPHLGGLGRQVHSMLGGASGAPGHHPGAAGAASVSGAVSEHGSLAGEFSDISHQSPPASVAPSRGGGRKSVASIASVGSRAGGDDDLGDYNSVVGSSVWRAPSQMATSSYAAAAGADDDFGDFTSDITSTSDFAPSTQPPSAVAVSGPGSVHPDDDFGSFASHRSTADDDEDDFGNFNAAPAAVGPAAVASGPSGSGGAIAGGAAAGPPGMVAAAGGSAVMPGAAAAAFSPRDASAHPYHSTQSVGPLPGGSLSAPEAGTANETGLLQLPSAELLQAVARALQPLLPAGTPGTSVPRMPDDHVVSAAWAQLRRHVQGNLGDAGSASIGAHNGVPFSPMGSIALSPEADGMPDSGAGRSGGTATVKFTRPLRWKGSESERRLLAGLGLSEVATQARMAEAMEGLRSTGRGRLESAIGPAGGARQMGPLASFGDMPRRARADVSTISAGLYRDAECDGAPLSSSVASGSRSRGFEQNGETHASPSEHGGGPASGAAPRASGSANGFGGEQQAQGVPAEK
ncbi:hypothetical protein Vafri_18456 [Volvox africanus]|uniref:Uncharacterized protein n=1 Tax=Volvox africanus TaxID=51714 RepID=A0A8J4BM34_9CHLO|nr:hypothetical protein Vafri_18456 [Volvox africanus]